MEDSKKLMIVDDEETLTYSLYQSFILAKQDYEVVTASSGEEASDKLKLDRYDLVITDISMPGMSGLELLAWIQENYPDTITVLITGIFTACSTAKGSTPLAAQRATWRTGASPPASALRPGPRNTATAGS